MEFIIIIKRFRAEARGGGSLVTDRTSLATEMNSSLLKKINSLLLINDGTENNHVLVV